MCTYKNYYSLRNWGGEVKFTRCSYIKPNTSCFQI